MLKKLMSNGIVVVVAAGAMALVGCGQNGGSSSNGGGGAGSGDGSASKGAESADSAGRATDAKPAGGVVTTGSTAFDDSSPEGAITTYINRLKAGDFLGAAEICIDGAPGTGELLTLGTKFNEMDADPEQASIGATARSLFVSDFKTLETVRIVEEEGVSVYEVSVLNKAPVNIRVELRDGVWRVIPPTNGTPIG
jgi:hypothetical protein